MTSGKAKSRRRYDAQFKAHILAECEAPGASVAKVAMLHGINDNVVHRWRQLAREAGPAALPAPATFVAMALPSTTEPTPAGDVRIELRRGSTTVVIAWPHAALSELATFTRELLR
ncbi:MAG: transposase [Ideonella sp.]|nr:transposase [Ideonella sp.]